MKHLRRMAFLVAALWLMSAPCASDAVDTVIRNAEADIARFEQQTNGLTPARRSNAQRILNLLNISYARLQESDNQSDPSWQAVNQRYLALKAQLETFLQPTSVQPADTQSATASPQQESGTVETMSPPNDTIAPLVSGERVRVKKLARDMESVKNGLNTTGPSTLQDPDEVASYQKGLQQFEEALSRYPQIDDPDVKTAQAEYDALRQKLSAEYERAKEQLAQLGDVQQRLATMEENNRTYAVPQPLAIPFSEEDANQWIQAAGSARTVAEHNLTQLAQIAPIAYLPDNPGTPQTGSPYDSKDIDRLKRNASDMIGNVENAYGVMAENLKNRLTQIEQELGTRFQDDPSGDKQWLFIGEGAEEEALKWYDENSAIAQSAVYLEKALNRDPSDALAMAEKIERAKKEFMEKRDAALEASRLPEPKSKDKKMLAIAQEILENPNYEYGEHGTIVLTASEIVERERTESEIEIDDAEVFGGNVTMSGTETTWNYKWQEFKFAVPLKESDSDTWYIWWITAKNFSSGGSRTPLNRWVSGEAVKGNLILKKNIF
ncbi:hypothetical protein KDK77_08915 [bacterium]|nr:hypothetical protein [bacterium]